VEDGGWTVGNVRLLVWCLWETFMQPRNVVFRRSKFKLLSKNSNLLMNKLFDFGELNN
jgi:hypothetical protein